MSDIPGAIAEDSNFVSTPDNRRQVGIHRSVRAETMDAARLRDVDAVLSAFDPMVQIFHDYTPGFGVLVGFDVIQGLKILARVAHRKY